MEKAELRALGYAFPAIFEFPWAFCSSVHPHLSPFHIVAQLLHFPLQHSLVPSGCRRWLVLGTKALQYPFSHTCRYRCRFFIYQVLFKKECVSMCGTHANIKQVFHVCRHWYASLSNAIKIVCPYATVRHTDICAHTTQTHTYTQWHWQ